MATILDQPAILADDIAEQQNWSQATFGPADRLEGVVSHILKELGEIVGDVKARELAYKVYDMGSDDYTGDNLDGNPKDASEWADLIVLAIDGATRQGISANAIINAYHAKMQKNYAREWPDWRDFGEDEAIEHIRSEEQEGLTTHRWGCDITQGRATECSCDFERYR